MPQTKARNSAGPTRQRKRSGGSSSKSKSRKSSASVNGGSASAKKATRATRRSSKAMAKKAKRSTGAIAKAVSNAKTPLIAGGAAAAGLASGVALSSRNGSGRTGLRRLPWMRSTSTADALMTTAKAIGKAGYKAGELTTEVRKVREQTK